MTKNGLYVGKSPSILLMASPAPFEKDIIRVITLYQQFITWGHTVMQNHVQLFGEMWY